MGCVAVGHLKGERLANAMMKCEIKAKRRVTLSICGLGMFDEAELESFRDAASIKPEPLGDEPIYVRLTRALTDHNFTKEQLTVSVKRDYQKDRIKNLAVEQYNTVYKMVLALPLSFRP